LSSFTDEVFAVGLQKIVNDFGAVLASRKTSYADASELPYPKYLIKCAMLAAISTTRDEKMKELLKSNFVLLADWQDGIGPGPHDLDLADRPGETDSGERKALFASGPSIYGALEKGYRGNARVAC
jgi:hypothetical protein